MAKGRASSTSSKMLTALALATMVSTANISTSPAWQRLPQKAADKPWLRKKKGRS